MKETGHGPEVTPQTEAAPRAEAVAQPAAVPDPGRRRWLVLAVIGVAQLMVVLDATIVNIALPSAQRALGFSVTDRQWVLTAYALAFGGLLVVGGRLSDLVGRKRTFVTGLAGFAAASAAGGAAQTFAELVAAALVPVRQRRLRRRRPGRGDRAGQEPAAEPGGRARRAR
jgi:sugar phosphate permease